MTATTYAGGPRAAAPSALDVVVLYGRQSQGSQKSIAEQLAIGEARASAEGWALHAAYRDEVSASRHASKARTDWPLLVADVRAGRVTVVWLWESSRGDRRASQWLAFLEDCRDNAVRIHVESHGRMYDMAVPRDWRVMAEDGTDNEYESEKTSLRVRRDMEAAAAKGRAHAQTPYGYRRVYQLADNGKKLGVRQEPEPVTSQVVKWIFGQLAAGASLRSIQRDLNAAVRHPWEPEGAPLAPVPTPGKSKAWSVQVIRNIALNPAYIGKRVHVPGSRGGSARRLTLAEPGAFLHEGQWPAIVDEALFWSVKRILTDPARRTRRPGKSRYLLSYLATCGVCEGPLSVMYSSGRPLYRCNGNGHVQIPVADLDEYVTREFRAHLARRGNWSRMQALDADTDDRELLAARQALAAAEAAYAETVDLFRRKKITPTGFAAVEPDLAADVERARTRCQMLEAPAPLRWLFDGPAEEAAVRFDGAPLTARRDAIRTLVTVAVDPAPGHQRVAAGKRTRVTPR